VEEEMMRVAGLPLRLVATAMFAVVSVPCFAGSVPVDCPAKLNPIRTVPPKLPARTEVIYEGKAEIAITINPKGRVSDPALVSNQVSNRLGGAADKLDGALLLAAVGQWRYAPRHDACRKQVTIEIRSDPQ
jgi:hypothetical protein